MKYEPCDLNVFKEWDEFNKWESKIYKPIHSFNLKEDRNKPKLPENQNRIFPETFYAVNLDKFKDMCAKRRRVKFNVKKSMDMAFMVIDSENKQNVVLVEYRLCFTSPKNLASDNIAEELKEKVLRSHRVIRHYFKKSVYRYHYLVFSVEQYPEMLRQVNRLKQENEELFYLKAVTIQMLFDEFFK